MKKHFVLILILNCSLLYSLDLRFSVQPFISYNNDTFIYSIYDGPYINSQLEWKSSYLFKLGINTEINYKNLIFDISNAAAIPLNCGTMYDSDWFTENIKTDLSKSDLKADFCYDLELNLKYRFELKNNYSIVPNISFNYSYTSLKADNTIGWCGDRSHTGLSEDYPWNSEYAVTVNKYGIDFYNHTIIFFCGCGIEKKINKFQINFDAAISPYIFISTIDHHLNNSKGRYFLLMQEAFFSAVNLELTCSYNITEKNRLCITPAFYYCPEIRGVFYLGKEKAKNNLADQPCSFSFNKFSITISYTVN